MYPLHYSQLHMYYVDKIGAGQALLLSGSMLFPQKVDIQKLQDAANELFRINDSLRTVFIEKDGKVYQESKPFERREFEVKHFSSKEELDKWASVYATIPFKLDITVVCENTKKKPAAVKPSFSLVLNVIKQKIKLFLKKVSIGVIGEEKSCFELILVDLPDRNGALIKMHHTIGDAWAIMLVANQFLRILDGKEVETYGYREFAETESNYFTSERHKRDVAYMEKESEKCPEPTCLWPEPHKTLEAKRRTVVLDRDMTEKIMNFCKENDTTPYVMFLSAICMYARHKLKRNTFYVGSVVLNRNNHKEKNTIGMFVDSAPLLIEIEDDFSFMDLLNHVKTKSIGVLRHYRGKKLYEVGKSKLFDIWVSYQNAKLDENADVECTQYYCNSSSDTMIFSIEDRSSEGQLKLHFDYNIKVPEKDADELFAITISALKKAVENKDIKVSELA